MPHPVSSLLLGRPRSRAPFRPQWRAALVVVCAAISAGCSSSGREATSKSEPAANNPAAEDSGTLAVTRADGSEVVMPALAPYVWCGPFSEGSIDLPAETVHIYLWPRLDPDFAGDPSGWIVRGVVDDIDPGQPLGLPTPGTELGDQPQGPSGVDIFAVVDLKDFASSAENSSGAIVFESVPCVDGEPTVSFTVEVVLGAEDGGGESIGIEGTFSGELNEPPQRDIYGS